MADASGAHAELKDNHPSQPDITLPHEPGIASGPDPESSGPTTLAKDRHPIFVIVMGVASTGKTTLGEAIAARLDIPYIEGDHLHPASNIAKMSAGIPLTDADREPWLALLRTTAERTVAEQQADPCFARRAGALITCSALRRYYRDILRGVHGPRDVPPIPTYFVYIKGDKELLLRRIEGRSGHFMKSNMLESQFATLESPEGEEGVVVVSAEDSTEDQVKAAVEGLEKLGAVVD